MHCTRAPGSQLQPWRKASSPQRGPLPGMQQEWLWAQLLWLHSKAQPLEPHLEPRTPMFGGPVHTVASLHGGRN